MKKYFLTSVLLAGFIAPGYAADDNFITGGANTCTVDVLKVSDNNATANTIAVWTLNEYECGAGQYLLNSDGTLECTECPVGSYCPGGTFTIESENNGTNACPTDYTSDAGAVGENECYMGCESVCATNATCPENATCTNNTTLKVSGKQYFGGSCNSYPSFCPIASMECNAGYNKQTATKTVEDISNLRWIANNPRYFSYCSANNVSIGAEVGYTSGCESSEPGTARFYNLDFTDLKFEITFNDYGPETSGIQNFEYTVSDETFNASYLENANFEKSAEGKYVWVRPIVAYASLEKYFYRQNALIKNYGIDKICDSVQLLQYISSNSLLPEELLQRFVSSDFNSEAEVEAFIDSEIKPLLSEEEIALLEYIPTGYFYLGNILYRGVLDEDIGSMMLVNGCISDDEYPTVEEMQNSLLAIVTFFGGNMDYLNIPWILPDQRLMQALFLEEGTELTEEQIVLVRETLAIAADTAFAALESKGGLSESYCVANEINISWNPDNGADNVQGMCYYGSDVLLPIPDPVKPGYTFSGWKLVEPNSTPVQ